MAIDEKTIIQRIYRMITQSYKSLYSFSMEHGLVPSSLYKIMNGKCSPSVANLNKIAQGLGVELSEFFFEEEEANGLADKCGIKREILLQLNNCDERLLEEINDYVSYLIERRGRIKFVDG